MFKQYKYFIFPVLISLFVSCAKKESQPILVRVGDRVVSVEEFLNRAELTPRPFYCRSNSEKHKIIALNAIIAEKLFALEEGEKSKLMTRPKFQAYIKGRKEQYMREELHRQIAEEPVIIDSVEIEKTIQLAGLTYDIEFYHLLDTQFVERLENKLLESPDSAAVIFNEIELTDVVPRKTIKYEDPEFMVIHESLYSNMLKPGEVVGPLKLPTDQYLIMKIKDVTYSPVITETEFANKKIFVKQRLFQGKSEVLWCDYVYDIMRDKDIRFNHETTLKLAEIYVNQLLQDRDKVNTHNNEFRGKEDAPNFNNLSDQDILLAAPMFRVDNQTWTVGQFVELAASHPLVFRNPEITQKEYLSQFRLAIADLMQDYYVTQEAYKQSVDKSDIVKRNTAMWKDSYLAIYHREKYLKSLSQKTNFDKKRLSSSYNYIDEYADQLQKKYSNKIQIDTKVLNQINLTKTDVFSAQQFVPYQLIVPSFPQLCVDEKIDYLKKELHNP